MLIESGKILYSEQYIFKGGDGRGVWSSTTNTEVVGWNPSYVSKFYLINKINSLRITTL